MHFILFAAVFVCGVSSESVPVLDKCSRKVEPIGCFKDQYRSRALPVQILNGRDKFSKTFNNDPIDWKNYHAYLQRFICSCAEIAFARGYKVIGIQFYGECWAGPEGNVTYSRHGESNLCLTQDMTKPVNEQYRRCNNDIICTGEQLTNYIYRIAPMACRTYFEPLGCYKDDLQKPRPFPDYIMNERDYSLTNWNGKLIDWENWNTYSPAMICRCAEKAKSLGHTHFGIQFYGECWAGEEDEKVIFRGGKVTPANCMAQNFKHCPYNSYLCVGKAKINSVYRIIKGPNEARKRSTAYKRHHINMQEGDGTGEVHYIDEDKLQKQNNEEEIVEREEELDTEIENDNTVEDIMEKGEEVIL